MDDVFMVENSTLKSMPADYHGILFLIFLILSIFYLLYCYLFTPSLSLALSFPLEKICAVKCFPLWIFPTPITNGLRSVLLKMKTGLITSESPKWNASKVGCNSAFPAPLILWEKIFVFRCYVTNRAEWNFDTLFTKRGRERTKPHLSRSLTSPFCFLFN